MKVSELTDQQKGRITFWLDNNTGYGLLTIIRVLKTSEDSIEELLLKFGVKSRSAKIMSTRFKNEFK